MRNLISNLNVTRDTRNSGILRDGFDGISTFLAAVFGKPLYAIAGRKSRTPDHTCPWHPRLSGQSPERERMSRQRECLESQSFLVPFGLVTLTGKSVATREIPVASIG